MIIDMVKKAWIHGESLNIEKKEVKMCTFNNFKGQPLTTDD
jgi:hypothetical protein